MREADKISLSTAIETPIWKMVCATEPERLIDVRMTYEDLKVLLDCYDNVQRFVKSTGHTASETT